MLTVTGLTKYLAGRTLFEDISWQLKKGDKVGLVGPNGVGKSTLLRILCKEEKIDAGGIFLSKDESIAYLPQEAPRAAHGLVKVMDRVLSAAAALQRIQVELTTIEAQLQHATSDTESMDLAHRHSVLLEKFLHLDGYTLESRAREILSGLGFDDRKIDLPISALSGGYWMRVELARLLLVQPDYLLLDEPTNHLDMESLTWLEDFLQDYPGAWVVVSHDRYFLNRMVDHIAELSPDSINVYPGNYDNYLEIRAALLAQAFHNVQVREKRHQEIRSFITRFGAKASKARQAQSRSKILEREASALEKDQEALKTSNRHMHLQLSQPVRSGKVVATLDNIGKRFGDNIILQGIHLTINRGDKIALVGPNGAGKSTLLKMLAGALACDMGTCVLGHNVTPYYYAQHQLDILNEKNTILDEMQEVMQTESITRVRTLLGAFLFSGDAVQKKIGVLSGGEKSRLALAKMLAQPANFLLLDEPTNHLDLQSREVLEEALANFSGSMVFVSHDRYFINRLASHILSVHPQQGVQLFMGDYDDYLSYQASQKKLHIKEKQPAPVKKITPKNKSSIENKIIEQEKRIKDIDVLLCNHDVSQNNEKYSALMKERQKLVSALENMYQIWETESSI